MIYNGDALAYIQDTPKILREILYNAEAITSDAVALIEGAAIEEIFIIGCGSSYHAAKASQKYMQDLLGVRVHTLSPGEILDNLPLINNKALVIGISQQGTSVGVISAMDKVREKSIPTVAMTGEYDTEITLHADATLYIECGYEDAGATTKGFTATSFTLMMLGKTLWERKNNITNEQKSALKIYFENHIRKMEEEFYLHEDMCQKLSEQLKASTNLIIIAGEQWKAMLGEIILKFSETCRFSIRGFEAEEFMHGLYNAVDNSTDFLFLWDDTSEDIKKLYDYYMAKGNKVFCIGKRDEIQKTKVLQNEHTALWEKGCFCVYRDLLLVQKVFVLTSRKRGINLNIPQDPDFHIIMGSKLEGKNK